MCIALASCTCVWQSFNHFLNVVCQRYALNKHTCFCRNITTCTNRLQSLFKNKDVIFCSVQLLKPLFVVCMPLSLFDLSNII